MTSDLAIESGGLDEATAVGAPADEAGPASGAGSRGLLAAVLVVVWAPIVVATVRGLARGWLPIGDNGILLARARDVGTEHHPLLGTWTSASLVVGDHVNNPGPLYFDLVAPWVRVLGPWVGLAVAVMVVNAGAAALAVVMARRLAGPVGMIGVALAVVGLEFAMGSELLYDVWQPNALVLPFLAFLVVVAAVAAGDLVAVPWLVGVASLLVQTHMSHAVLVGLLGVAALAVCAWQVRRARPEPVAWRRPVLVGVVVAVVAWCQPLIEQFTGRGEGNLSRIAGAATGGDAAPIGWGRAVRIVGELLAGSPWFTRGTYGAVLAPATDGGDPVDALMGVGPAVVVVLVAVGGLAAAAVWAFRAGRTGIAAILGTGATAVAACVVALATSPLAIFGVTAHQMRWAWGAAAFAYAAAACLVGSLIIGADPAGHEAPHTLLARRRVLGGLAVATLAVVAVVNLPTYRAQGVGPTTDAAALPAARELVAGLGELDGRGTVLFDPTTLTFAEPYSGLVFAELQDQGVPFVFDDEGFIRQFGEGRRHDGDARLRMWEVLGPQAEEVPSGAERVGFAEGPSGPVALFVEPIG